MAAAQRVRPAHEERRLGGTFLHYGFNCDKTPHAMADTHTTLNTDFIVHRLPGPSFSGERLSNVVAFARGDKCLYGMN